MKNKKTWLGTALYFLAGIAVVFAVAVLSWFDFTFPLDLHRPAVSPDGDYFAYFDRVGRNAFRNAASNDLIISTVEGEAVAQYPMEPGDLMWSSAGHLMVVQPARSKATLVPNTAGTFVVLTTLALSPGTEPKWARSGTKLGYIRSGASGPEISEYDLLQTQASRIPLPANLHLDHPVLLAWSPGGEDLYFLNLEEKQSVLYKVDAVSGQATPLAKSDVGWSADTAGVPEISPDGGKIFLPRPINSVIDSEAGATLWTLPPHGTALGSPWSAEGGRLFYSRSDSPGKIYAHDFSSGSDQLLLSNVPADGFFSENGGSYFYKLPASGAQVNYLSRLKQWLRTDWGWRHVDMVTTSALPMGREELWPGRTTRRGLIQMSRDDYFRVRYGLYDPGARILEDFRFPSDGSDVRREAGSRAIILATVILYGLLGFFVFLARPSHSASRALYLISLVLMMTFISLDLARTLHATYALRISSSSEINTATGDWSPLMPRASFMADQFLLFLAVLAALPPALLRFAAAFPEGNRFLAPRKYLQIPLYVVASLPALAILSRFSSYQVPSASRPAVLGAILAGGGAAVGTAFLALFYNLRHPPDRRARDQVRWVAAAFSFPIVGIMLVIGVHALLGAAHGGHWRASLGSLSTTVLSTLCLFTPLAIGYALLAHKLFDIHLLFLRTLRYSLLTGAVAVVYLASVGGISWAIAGSLGKPSLLVFVMATILTAIIFAPARTRLERVIDRSISREHFDFSETLQNFAEGLPNIVDRQILATVMGQTVRGSVKAQAFFLFALNRRARKFRLEKTERDLPPGIAAMEFDPSEPLCKYLLERGRPFEVEVSPYDPRLIPVFQSAADRLAKLHAAIIFGLVRREELIGMMVLGSKTYDEFFNSEELDLLQTVARQAGAALENSELLEEVTHSREMGRDMEVPEGQFFPGPIPNIRGCDVAGRSIAGRSMAGDYYDFLDLSGQRVGLVIGCVSGKGVEASVLMASLQSQLREEAASARNFPAQVRRINRQLFASFRGAKYCTLFYSAYDPSVRRLEFINAGHNPPLVLGPKGIRYLASTGVPLGLFAETTHDVRLATIEHGATVILFSDGVAAARDKQGEPFGLDRLMASVTRAAGEDAAGAVDKILNDVRDFTDGRPSAEDRTVVVLKVTET